MTQYEHRRAVKAAKVIKRYCETRPDHSCNNCVFYKFNSGCVVNDLPEDWNLKKRNKSDDNG